MYTLEFGEELSGDFFVVGFFFLFFFFFPIFFFFSFSFSLFTKKGCSKTWI